MTSRKTKHQVFKELFIPDEDGKTEWKTREDLIGNILELGNNGNARNNVLYGLSQYKWDIRRGKCNKIMAMRTIGFSEEDTKNRPINKAIRTELLEKYKNCIHCGGTKNLVIDHKNDLYNDPRVLNSKTQTINDFQVLCNKCNKDLKHHIGQKWEKKHQTSFSAKKLGISAFKWDDYDYPWEKKVYDESDSRCQLNSYWYDVEEFHRLRNIYNKYTRPLNNEIKYKSKLTI